MASAGAKALPVPETSPFPGRQRADASELGKR